MPLLTAAFWQALAEPLPEDLCEFEYPRLQTEYWPVLSEDPHKGGRELPVMDLIVTKEGKPMQAVLLGTEHLEEKGALMQAAAMLDLSPAYSCGEPVEGFFRYTVKSYFYPKGNARDKVDSFPQAIFKISPDVVSNLFYPAMVEKQYSLTFEMEVSEDGSVRKIKGKDRWAKHLTEAYLSTFVAQMRFNPAHKDGAAVPFDLVLVLDLHDQTAGGAAASILAEGGYRKPLPARPDSGQFEPGKEHVVILDLYRNGTVRNIQFLTIMNPYEAICALNAFRNWQVVLPDKKKRAGNRLKVKFAYLEDAPSAVIIEEDFGLHMVPPRPIRRPAPIYPSSLRRKGRQGIVVVEFVVTSKGRTSAHRAVVSSGPQFSHAAIAAVKKWRFEPGTVDGQPVNTRVRVPIPFKIRRN